MTDDRVETMVKLVESFIGSCDIVAEKDNKELYEKRQTFISDYNLNRLHRAFYMHQSTSKGFSKYTYERQMESIITPIFSKILSYVRKVNLLYKTDEFDISMFG